MMTTDATLRLLWRPRAIVRAAIPLLLVFILAWVDKHWVSSPQSLLRGWREPTHYALVLVDALIAVSAVRAFTKALGGALENYLDLGRARSAATFVSIILHGIVIMLAITGAGFDLSGLLVGGALTGVIVGVAAQASLSNIFAGLAILFARPYSAGMYVTVRTTAFGGVEYSGQVRDVGLFYTTLHSDGQEIRIPNSTMVAAVVVLRPQQLDVYIPVTLPSSADLPACLELLRRDVESCTAAQSAAQVALESVTKAGYVVGVRVFVASEAEQRAVERAITSMASQEQGSSPILLPT
ncbi:MAG TPA: mechanosensitive ion channel family protein [Chloroflexota bacterium]|nr:mechanosensitive ion channel family protein [Chloroflexota bacterium]